MTDDTERHLQSHLTAGCSDQDVLDAIQDYLFHHQKFRAPLSGASNIPKHSSVEAPGVWENPGLAYLNTVLIQRVGIPAVLAIILGDVLRRLSVSSERINFYAKVNCGPMTEIPSAEIIHGMSPVQLHGIHQGRVLNACSFAAIREELGYLKRAYWPFPWDGETGGFGAACRQFLEGADSAELEAINRTAFHRLERGIWTSPGAGDIRRSLAACERMVVLNTELDPIKEGEDRRDLAILYCHVGRLEEAVTELTRSRSLLGYRNLEFGYHVDNLIQMLQKVTESNTRAPRPYLTLEEALRRCHQSLQHQSPTFLPLTW